MSRATVRAATLAFLNPPNVTGLNIVFKATPKILVGSQRFATLPSGTATATAGVIHIVGEHETRIGIGGAHAGKKRIDYDMGLQLYCVSTQLLSEDAMSDFDAVVENIKVKLRSDHNFGTDPAAGGIFQAAEPDISGEYSDPVITGTGQTEIWGALRFSVSEIING